MCEVVPTLLLRVCTGAQSLEHFLGQAPLPEGVRFVLDTAKHSNVVFRTFLRDTFINCPIPPAFASCRPSDGVQVASMRDLVYSSVSTHLDAARFQAHSANVLCLGYRRLHREQAVEASWGSLGLENYYPNDLLTHMLTKEWQRLLLIVGEDLIMHILRNAVIVIRRPNGGLLQVAGHPITPTWSATRSSIGREGPIIISRHRMLYASPNNPQPRGGLPFSHPLNRSKSAHKIQCLTRAIFHTSPKRRSSKFHKILLGFTASLLGRHRKCPYAQLYEYHCADFETSIVKPSAMGVERQGAGLWRNVVKLEKVTAFIKAVLIRLLAPSDKLRSLSSFHHIVRVVHNLLFMRKGELIDVEHLMNGLSSKETWSLISNDVESGFKHCGKEEAKAIGHSIKHFFAWILNDLVIPLVKNNFYVTESSLHRNRLFFFRRDRWSAYFNLELKRLTATGFLEALPATFDPRDMWQSLGVGTLRFIPKEIGFRPIMGMQRRIFKGRLSTGTCVNSLLRNVHAVLDFYRQHRPSSMGSSLICMNKVYERLFRFRAQNSLVSDQHFFMVKVDLRSCYDTIPHDKLLAIIEALLDAPGYIIRRYETLSLVDDQVRKRVRRSAHPVDDVSTAPKGPGKGLLIDRVIGQRIDRHRVIQLIREHVTRNVIKVNTSYYRQKVGIPQGSIISPLLCSFFYAKVDRTYLAKFREHPGSLLMRFVDDIIFISLDKQLVDEFVGLLACGFPEYGAVFNISKTAANFDHPLLPRAASGPFAPFPWCGLLLDPRNLRVTADYGKFFNMPIADSICIDYTGPSPASKFARYLGIYAKPKLHPLFLSTELNGHDIVSITMNIYQLAMMTAIKSHAYQRDLKRITGYAIDSGPLLRAVEKLGEYVEYRVRELCSASIIHGSSLTRKLVLRAFLEVWGRFTNYDGVLSVLDAGNLDEELQTVLGDESHTRVLVAGRMMLTKIQL